ncbi:oxidoreductase [Klebsiella sp. H-Nf2]|uniref:Gfo/Idh/MocA family oxidoreductase n=1 Tax=Klebsiella sp. H-Nf2 TaxID=2054599 RepID=UPI000C2817AD|nr:Gfo/Idh/MocA family oxidoreductase [Klebsiella sp. H-Nf2]PJR50401.1 oxidoreductase [Klebsiella sp. H-Nf2]
MQIGFIGLGAVVETAYLPVLRRLGYAIDNCWGYDLDSSRALPGIQRCSSLAALLAKPLDTLFITTSSLQHLPVLERALASGISRIVVEKPIVANLEQAARLRALLAPAEQARRVLALDHWMARGVALNAITPSWRAEEIVWLEGYLQEPSGFNAAGEPVALNFATGELDTRQLRHPDGVILDIGTHVLAMLRETLHASGGDAALSLSVRVAKDRLGHDIAPGDTVTAEGEAHLQGTLGTIPLNIWLNKYAGPAGGQKGMRIGLQDGRTLTLDRCPEGEVVTLNDGERIQHWTRPGTIYAHCLDEQILGADNLFIRAPDSVAGLTRRRLEEVEWLLRLQQQLRGPH